MNRAICHVTKHINIYMDILFQPVPLLTLHITDSTKIHYNVNGD